MLQNICNKTGISNLLELKSLAVNIQGQTYQIWYLQFGMRQAVVMLLSCCCEWNNRTKYPGALRKPGIKVYLYLQFGHSLNVTGACVYLLI